MRIPTGMTEDQVVEIINNVVNRLARKFVFGYFDVDEIKQYGRQFAIEAMPDYDEKRPLENFLWTHVHNRLCNLKRNKYERLSKPCAKCAARNDGSLCDKCEKRQRVNSSKKNLMCAIGIDETCVDGETNMYTSGNVLEDIANREILSLIDTSLSVDSRPIFIKLKNGIKISKAERKQLLDEIKDIINDD
jgi:hypothetical protein